MMQNLPVHKAPADIWQNISDGLDNNLASKLPLHEAPQGLWHGIERRMERKKRIILFTPLRAVAASIIAIISLTFVLTNYSGTRDYLVEEEYIQNIDREPEQYIKRHNVNLYCNQFPEICSTEKFIDLKSQIEKLEEQKNQLKALQSFDNDPQIAVYIEYINTEISTIERTLIAMF